MIRTGPPHPNTVTTRPLSDLCTCCCTMSKDVCQQVVRGAQTRDMAAVKLAEVVISIDMLDAVPIDRGCDRTWSWHHHPPCRSASWRLLRWAVRRHWEPSFACHDWLFRWWHSVDGAECHHRQSGVSGTPCGSQEVRGRRRRRDRADLTQMSRFCLNHSHN